MGAIADQILSQRGGGAPTPVASPQAGGISFGGTPVSPTQQPSFLKQLGAGIVGAAKGIISRVGERLKPLSVPYSAPLGATSVPGKPIGFGFGLRTPEERKIAKE